MHAGNLLLSQAILAITFTTQATDTATHLLIGPSPNGVELSLSRELVPPIAGTQFSLNLETSTDLLTWSPKGQMETDDEGSSHVTVLGSAPHEFIRLRPALVDSGSNADGGEIFGYDRAFQEESKAVGFLKPEEFAAAHQPSASFVKALSFDPTTAKYWDRFNEDPAVYNAGLPPDSPNRRLYDFRLNPAELAIFKTNGFVVSERLGSTTFADAFYRIFADDFPVFISADAALHAWHFSYQRLLEESEETQLAPALQQILDGMHQQLAQTSVSLREGPLADSVKDADYFLAVGRSLLAGQRVDTIFGAEKALTNTLAAIAQLELMNDFEIFGSSRPFDFSQFTVRGHYQRSDNLGRYFQAFMWTARADLQIFAAKTNSQLAPGVGHRGRSLQDASSFGSSGSMARTG